MAATNWWLIVKKGEVLDKKQAANPALAIKKAGELMNESVTAYKLAEGPDGEPVSYSP